MKKSCFKDEREADFIAAFNEEMKELGDMAPYIPKDALLMKTIYSGRGRYYITFEEAARNVRKVLEHIPIACKNSCKMAMYEEMALKTADYMTRYPSLNYREALYRVLADCKASRFFFGLQTARLIVYQHHRRQREMRRAVAKRLMNSNNIK